MSIYDSLLKPASAPASGKTIYDSLIGTNGGKSMTFPVSTPEQSAAFAQAAQPVVDNSAKTKIAAAAQNIPVDFAKSLWATWDQTPAKMSADIRTAADTMVQGNALKGILQAGGRTAGDAAIAIFAPFSAAIGSVLTNLGGQSLTDNAGQVIANSTGITDIPAFQKVAMEHPNAGEDFNRFMTLVMGAFEKGKIDPARLVQETSGVALKLTGQSPDATMQGAKAYNDTGPVRSVPVTDTSTGGEPRLWKESVMTRASNDPEPVVRTKSVVQAELDAAKSQYSYMKEYLNEHPGKGVGKYLDNLKGGFNGGEFKKGGDAAYQNAVGQDVSNGGDINTLLSHAESYKSMTDQLPQMRDTIKALSEEVKKAPADKPVATATPEPAAQTQASTETVPPREDGVTKTASDINQNLVRQGFDALPPEEQAKYSPQSYKEVADTVAKMMDANIEEVKSMARGDTPIPEGINSEILFNAVEAHAMATGDGALLRDLAGSSVSKTSEAAQTLGGHGYNDNPNSPVDIIKAVKDARAAAFKDKGVKIDVEATKLGESVRATMKKSARPSWETFISEIMCGY